MAADAVLDLPVPEPPPPVAPVRRSRQEYLEWVEEQVEAYKDALPRSDLLSHADQVVDELRMTKRGQYQLTEILLCAALDRHIFRLLKLPSYRVWLAERDAAR